MNIQIENEYQRRKNLREHLDYSLLTQLFLLQSKINILNCRLILVVVRDVWELLDDPFRLHNPHRSQNVEGIVPLIAYEHIQILILICIGAI
jgi:hypothetical protein